MDSGARLPSIPLSASAEWGQRLASARAGEAVEAVDPARLDRCHQQFRDISQRTRALWNRIDFRPELLPRIMRLGEQSLALSRMICDELVAHTVNAGIFLPVPFEVLEELLAANAALVDWLTDRLDAVTRFSPLSAGLKTLAEDIASGKERSSRRLRSLSTEFVLAAVDSPALSFQTSADAAAVAEIFSPAGDPRHGWFAQGSLTAWLLARATAVSDIVTETQQRLVIAALMQDLCGWSDAIRRMPQTDHPLATSRRLPPYHPSTSAAMLSGLSETPAEISLLVGAHHERCDGSGFPQRLSGARFSTTAQRLAWTVRFSELVLDPLTSELATSAGDALDSVAGVRLWREVARGAFDQYAVHDWLQEIRASLPDEIAALVPKYQQRFVDQPHRELTGPHLVGTDSMRIDGTPAEEGIAAPQFMKRGRRLAGTHRPLISRQRKGLPS